MSRDALEISRKLLPLSIDDLDCLEVGRTRFLVVSNQEDFREMLD